MVAQHQPTELSLFLQHCSRGYDCNKEPEHDGAALLEQHLNRSDGPFVAASSRCIFNRLSLFFSIPTFSPPASAPSACYLTFLSLYFPFIFCQGRCVFPFPPSSSPSLWLSLWFAVDFSCALHSFASREQNLVNSNALFSRSCQVHSLSFSILLFG